MPRVPIGDLDDPRIAMYRGLKASNLTRRGDQFVVEGEKLFERLLASRYPLASALATERLASRIEPRVPGDVPLFVVPDRLIDLLVGFNFHQGVLACGRRLPWPPVGDLIRGFGDRSAIVVCPTLNNPENLGAIVRIGDVFGIDAVLIGERCPDPLSRRVLRVSMGSALRLPVVPSKDLADDVARLRAESGYELLASVVDAGAEPVGGVARTGRFALFLGNEPDGLGPDWAGRCDRLVTIPMRGGAESLNVAVAAGIMLYSLLAGGGE